MATAYEKVQLARGKGRPSGLSFIQNIFPDFIELHGDRRLRMTPRSSAASRRSAAAR